MYIYLMAKYIILNYYSVTIMINIEADSDFTIHNIPFGVYEHSINGRRRPCSAIGNYVIDLYEVAKGGFFQGTILENTAVEVFDKDTLNAFMELGRSSWKCARQVIQRILAVGGPLENDTLIRDKILLSMKSVKMVLPITIGDYTDFYSSKEHATNVGIMFRGKDNALQPNYLHLPVGYHGRSSSVVISGTPIHRPLGQIKPSEGAPKFGATKKLDFELEMAFVVGKGNALGEPIPVEQADDHIFGVVLMNDWSGKLPLSW